MQVGGIVVGVMGVRRREAWMGIEWPWTALMKYLLKSTSGSGIISSKAGSPESTIEDLFMFGSVDTDGSREVSVLASDSSGGSVVVVVVVLLLLLFVSSRIILYRFFEFSATTRRSSGKSSCSWRYLSDCNYFHLL